MKNNNISILQKTSAICGIIVFLIGIPVFIILGYLKPGYAPLRHTVSELGEFGGYNYLVVGVLFIMMGILEVIFSIGLFSGLKKSASAVTGTILLICHGIFDDIGSGIFPCDPGGAYESFSGQMHFFVSVIGMVSLVIAPFFFWRAFYVDKRSSNKRLLPVTAVIAVIIAVAAVLFNISFFTNTLVGLTQRLVYFPYYIWVLIVSIKMIVPEKKKNIL